MAASLVGILNSNQEFLDLYSPYIKHDWRRHYFAYDHMKAQYKTLKGNKNADIKEFEEEFYAEICRVDWFLKLTMKDIQHDLRKLIQGKVFVSEHASQKYQVERTVELTLRSLFDRCKACEQFYQLNHFVICKIAKKFEKIIEKSRSHSRPSSSDDLKETDSHDDFVPWCNFRSNRYFTTKLAGRIDVILQLKSRCIAVYSDYFRQKYPSLAFGELEFMKNKDREKKSTRILFGIKLGCILCLILWVILGSQLTKNDLHFWSQPGLFVYTTVGNLLLFRFLWALNIFIWARYDINYIPILSLSNLKPNLLAVSNSTATLLLIYCISLVIFFEANRAERSASPLSYITPLLLVVWSICYEIYDYMFFTFNGMMRHNSRGLFSSKVVYRCITAPFAMLQFRDIFAADVVTSFTKVISDAMYAGCWIISGAFLTPHRNSQNETLSSNTDFGSSYLTCTSNRTVIVVAIVECLPLWVRLMQCLRQFKDSNGQVWPFLFNALKYMLSIVVILYGANTTVTSLDPAYLTLIVVTTLYKWWWDVVMDWGLFEVMPTIQSCLNSTGQLVPDAQFSSSIKMAAQSSKSEADPSGKSTISAMDDTEEDVNTTRVHHPHWFLRPLLLYNSASIYYLCIVLDLMLRFLWVTSLVPKTVFGAFIGPQLSFFLGSMEIFRRAMWGALRLEYEHLKHVVKGTPGFLKFRRVHYKPHQLHTHNHSDDHHVHLNYLLEGSAHRLSTLLRTVQHDLFGGGTAAKPDLEQHKHHDADDGSDDDGEHHDADDGGDGDTGFQELNEESNLRDTFTRMSSLSSVMSLQPMNSRDQARLSLPSAPSIGSQSRHFPPQTPSIRQQSQNGHVYMTADTDPDSPFVDHEDDLDHSNTTSPHEIAMDQPIDISHALFDGDKLHHSRHPHVHRQYSLQRSDREDDAPLSTNEIQRTNGLDHAHNNIVRRRRIKDPHSISTASSTSTTSKVRRTNKSPYQLYPPPYHEVHRRMGSTASLQRRPSVYNPCSDATESTSEDAQSDTVSSSNKET